MVTTIRIYIEGDPDLREGFRKFLNPIYDKARQKSIRIDTLKLCGSRGDALKAYRIAKKRHPNEFVVLLIDSEEEVTDERWLHLKNRDSEAQDMTAADAKHCHLMVQVMESWFLADAKALKSYYGSDFNLKAIGHSANIERVDKSDVYTKLENATKTTKKDVYHKTQHAVGILKCLDPDTVRKASQHCDALFTTLLEVIG